jgi:hypothetical protein
LLRPFSPLDAGSFGGRGDGSRREVRPDNPAAPFSVPETKRAAVCTRLSPSGENRSRPLPRLGV